MKDILKINAVRVGLILIAALMGIIYFNPPHTPCQSQVEIYLEGVKPIVKPFAQGMKLCREHTDPGGCVSFGENLTKLENKYNEVGHQCQPTLKSDASTKDWITQSMEIFVKAAWGSKPPVNYTAKNGWLGLSQIVEYCRLRQHLESIYGTQSWNDFIEDMLRDLPGAQALGRNEAWNRSLISDTCHYPL
jgi:hypothetical protein